MRRREVIKNKKVKQFEKQTIHHKGYSGTLEYSEEDEVYYGKLTGINDLISYEGKTTEECIEDFMQAVNEYIKDR